MTLKITIHNPAGTQYAAVVSQNGKDDVKLEPGTASDFTIYTGAEITGITETAAAPVEQAAEESVDAEPSDEAVDAPAETETKAE